MSIKLWYGTGQDKNLYGYLNEFCNIAQIDPTPWINRDKNAPFGLGVESETNKMLIQKDGIEWFCNKSSKLKRIVEDWKKENQFKTIQITLSDKQYQTLMNYAEQLQIGINDVISDCINVLDNFPPDVPLSQSVQKLYDTDIRYRKLPQYLKDFIY